VSPRLHLVSADPAEPDPALAELREKYEHARRELREAEYLRGRLMVALTEPGVPAWAVQRLEVELELAGRRLDLYDAVLAKLREQLLAAGVQL
jgi:hypothetical protein